MIYSLIKKYPLCTVCCPCGDSLTDLTLHGDGGYWYRTERQLWIRFAGSSSRTKLGGKFSNAHSEARALPRILMGHSLAGPIALAAAGHHHRSSLLGAVFASTTASGCKLQATRHLNIGSFCAMQGELSLPTIMILLVRPPRRGRQAIAGERDFYDFAFFTVNCWT